MRGNRAKRGGLSVLTALTVGLVTLAPAATATAGTAAAAPAALYSFPSSSSTVVASIGFINATEAGYFWSAARGDSVSQTFSGPAAITKAQLKVYVVTNVLNSGAFVNWDLVINGVTVANFTVSQGYVGPIKVRVSFASIAGPTYAVVLRVTNEVASGQGSHTLAYAGSFVHALKLAQ